MRRLLKSPTRLIAARTSKARYPAHDQNGRTPATMLAYNSALEALEATWFRRSQEQSFMLLNAFEESKAVWSKRSKEKQAKLLKDFTDQVKNFSKQWATLHKDFDAEQEQFQAKTDQLALQNRDLLKAALEERTVKMKLEGNYNLRGALELIVYLAKLEKKVPPTVGVQEGLDKLAQSNEFTAILHKEVQARKLSVTDVMASISHLYDEVCNRTNGDDDTIDYLIIVRTTKFNDNERAALAIFLKVQDNWQNRLEWMEGEIMEGAT
ncbi:hypothetical protein B9Z19DRAFT_1089895 [Tuber borchii]|uniref:Uncharacterized protein n=1 Tax=Tuber borchii TaxID=42251 RepID=A0A2T6ZJI2_TUBBO|nr:hypothetical protein B9Z19DRAFT_1089895 [Tuber borchii]